MLQIPSSLGSWYNLCAILSVHNIGVGTVHFHCFVYIKVHNRLHFLFSQMLLFSIWLFSLSPILRLACKAIQKSRSVVTSLTKTLSFDFHCDSRQWSTTAITSIDNFTLISFFVCLQLCKTHRCCTYLSACRYSSQLHANCTASYFCLRSHINKKDGVSYLFLL